MFSQTGPGGVGSIDGTSNLKIWLRGSDINADGDITNNPALGSRISSWNDYSGNGNNFTNTGNRRPTYALPTFNAVNFNAGTNPAQFLNATSTGTYTNASAFFALNPVNSGRSNTFFDGGSLSLRVEQWSNTNRIGYTRYGVADYQSTLPSPFGANTIVSFHKNNASSSVNIFSNNLTSTINVGSSTVGIPYDRIGRNTNGADEASGDFYEVILYNNRLSLAEKNIVDNYLSAKLGSIAISDNIYNEDENGDFDHKVAGIGQATDGTNHTDSQGTGIVKISNPNDLQNDEYLFWGENVMNASYNFSAVASPSKRYQIDTKWRVSERSDVGAVNFSLNASDLDLTGTPAGILKLVRSTASDFSTIVEEYNLTLSGGVYSSTATFNDNDYFTLEIVPTSDLSLTKTVDKALPKVGEVVVFTLSITNNGPQDATGVLVRDLLPTGLSFNLANSTITSGTYNSTTGDWDLSGVTIINGQTVTIEIAATVNVVNTIINTSEIISLDQEDPDSIPDSGN
ncbi:hypothetical protein LPB136_09610 [Tenacibaculum todarodis]|uniref:Uncharacterized protein n=2 Tax=Tenacibaculum todarodis TaxID=1850252 RepID=A0A1L3JKI7_9FLAO|nr:hypothetical protein LPB136_09610 [Tenacibaculum todarodis]